MLVPARAYVPLASSDLSPRKLRINPSGANAVLPFHQVKVLRLLQLVVGSLRLIYGCSLGGTLNILHLAFNNIGLALRFHWHVVIHNGSWPEPNKLHTYLHSG
jgi:hypothetical protein